MQCAALAYLSLREAAGAECSFFSYCSTGCQLLERTLRVWLIRPSRIRDSDSNPIRSFMFACFELPEEEIARLSVRSLERRPHLLSSCAVAIPSSSGLTIRSAPGG